MKKFIPLICAAAVLAGCGKVEQNSKKDSVPVVKGGIVMPSEGTSVMEETLTSAGEKTEKSEKTEKTTQAGTRKPAEKTSGEKKELPTSAGSIHIAGQRTSSEPPAPYVPKPVKPSSGGSRPSETSPDPTEPEQDPTEPSGEEQAPPRAVFSAALGGILKEGIVPGYGQVDTAYSDITQCEFAVADIDGDGAEELVFLYNNDSSIGNFGEIYGIDEEGALYEKLNAYPSMTFYNNGTLMVDFSHDGQRPSGGFISYTLYVLSADGRSYVSVAEVQALDKAEVDAIVQEAEEAGTVPAYTYPEEADISGYGKVYYIKPTGSSDEALPCDVTEYEVWLSQYIGGASLVSLDYKKLTSDNISALTE